MLPRYTEETGKGCLRGFFPKISCLSLIRQVGLVSEMQENPSSKSWVLSLQSPQQSDALHVSLIPHIPRSSFRNKS